MPIYEYRCQDCGHELEALQKISDPKLTTCPECGKDALTKLVSASAFVLKGSGWYATDFRDKDKPKARKDGDKSESAGSESGSGDKSESRADTKSEGKSGSKSNSDTSSGDNKTKGEDKKGDSKPQKKAAGE